MKTIVSVLAGIVMLTYSIRITDSIADEPITQQSFDEIRNTFNNAFLKELNTLSHTQESIATLTSDFLLIPEILWEKDQEAWKPSSFSIAAHIRKMLPGSSIERHMRYHGIWHSAFRDVSHEPDVVRDAAHVSLNFSHEMAGWKWADPHPLLNSSFATFLSQFEGSFRFYEFYLGLGVSPHEPKLHLLFDYFPFPGSEIIDIGGMVSPFPFTPLIGRVALSEATHRSASEKIAKQSFNILAELRDFYFMHNKKRDVPFSAPPRRNLSFSP